MKDEQITLNASQYCDTMNDKNEDIKLVRFASYIAGATTTKDIIEKENAELDMKRKAERKIFQGIVEKKNDQLTKAKEIIQLLLNDFLYLCDMTNNSSCYESIEKAGQFLKENK